MTLEKYFEGEQNLNEGTRRGSDKTLEELLNAVVTPQVLGEFTGTGAAQSLPHTLGKVPAAVLVGLTSVATTAAVVEGTHTASNVLVTVTSGAKFKVLVF
jgi:hypothetical protein